MELFWVLFFSLYELGHDFPKRISIFALPKFRKKIIRFMINHRPLLPAELGDQNEVVNPIGAHTRLVKLVSLF